MRRIKLIWITVAIWVVAAGLFLVFRSEISWASRSLPEYMRGSVLPLTESEMTIRAQGLLRRGDDPAEARRLLEQAAMIDPNSIAVFVLGEWELEHGSADQALEQFRAYLQIDPSYFYAYLRIARLLDKRELQAERRAILERGVAALRQQVELWAPHEDRSVMAVYNDKARAVYTHYVEGLDQLERELSELAGLPAEAK